MKLPLAETAMAIAGVCYLVVAYDLWMRNVPWLSTQWGLYAASNVAAIIHFWRALPKS